MACFYAEDDGKVSYQRSPEEFLVHYGASERTNTLLQ